MSEKQQQQLTALKDLYNAAMDMPEISLEDAKKLYVCAINDMTDIIDPERKNLTAPQLRDRAIDGDVEMIVKLVASNVSDGSCEYPVNPNFSPKMISDVCTKLSQREFSVKIVEKDGKKFYQVSWFDSEPKLDPKPEFVVSTFCQTDPCEHLVTIDGETKMWGGSQIYYYYVDHQIEVPEHFKGYGESILAKARKLIH